MYKKVNSFYKVYNKKKTSDVTGKTMKQANIPKNKNKKNNNDKHQF